MWAKIDKEKAAITRSQGPSSFAVVEAYIQCAAQEVGFYTLQLRSVDEGQIRFYECPDYVVKYLVLVLSSEFGFVVDSLVLLDGAMSIASSSSDESSSALLFLGFGSISLPSSEFGFLVESLVFLVERSNVKFFVGRIVQDRLFLNLGFVRWRLFSCPVLFSLGRRFLVVVTLTIR